MSEALEKPKEDAITCFKEENFFINKRDLYIETNKTMRDLLTLLRSFPFRMVEQV